MTDMKIGIIDIGKGNLTSVKNAFESLGCLPSIIQAPDELHHIDRIILPGVGAFGDAMEQLKAGGWIPVLNEEVNSNEKPFLGICLGMQVLVTQGHEHGTYPGLGWIRGEAVRLHGSDDHRIPHIGWDDVQYQPNQTMYSGMSGTGDFYFVHSYIIHPEEEEIVSGICDYGERFAASIQVKNIWATQFHPEKSQKLGLKVLKNFITTGG